MGSPLGALAVRATAGVQRLSSLSAGDNLFMYPDSTHLYPWMARPLSDYRRKRSHRLDRRPGEDLCEDLIGQLLGTEIVFCCGLFSSVSRSRFPNRRICGGEAAQWGWTGGRHWRMASWIIDKAGPGCGLEITYLKVFLCGHDFIFVIGNNDPLLWSLMIVASGHRGLAVVLLLPERGGGCTRV